MGLPVLFLVVLGDVFGAGVFTSGLKSLLVGVNRFLELCDGVNLGVSVSEFCSRIESLTLSLKELVRPLLKLDLLSSSTLDDRPREILLLRLLAPPSLELDRSSILSPASSSRSTWEMDIEKKLNLTKENLVKTRSESPLPWNPWLVGRCMTLILISFQREHSSLAGL